MKLLKTLAFTLSVFLMSCSSSTDNSNNMTIKKIDAVDLSKDILENQIAAEIKYLEKELIITNCVVLEIGRGANMSHMYWPSDDDNTIYITISVGDKYNVNNHTFWLKKDQSQIASELKKNQIIRVRGLVKHVWAREAYNCGEVNMDDCTILQNEDGSYIWEYDSQETAYVKMKEEQKQARLKEQIEREKAEMKNVDGFKLIDHIEFAKYGILIPVDNVKRMSEAMGHVYKDKKIRKKYINNSTRAIYEFSKPNIGLDYFKS